VKYAFIQRHRREWPISVQCRVLEVSVAGYHEHFVRKASAAQRRHLSDDALLVHIKAIHAETRGGYGWPRTWKELLARGIRVGKERVQKLMKLHGIRAKGSRRFKVMRTVSIFSASLGNSRARRAGAAIISAHAIRQTAMVVASAARVYISRLESPRMESLTGADVKQKRVNDDPPGPSG